MRRAGAGPARTLFAERASVGEPGPEVACRGTMPPKRHRHRRRSTPTPAQIWRIFHGAAHEARIAKRERAELVRRLDRDLAARRKELEEEAAARKKDLDEKAAALAAEFRRADEKRKKADEERKREQAERDRELDKRFNQLVGEADRRWGKLAEGFVEQDLVKLLRDADVNVLRAVPGWPVAIEGEWRQYDLVAVGEHDAVVVEVKSTLKPADVTQFTKRLRDFRKWCPEFARSRIMGAMACLVADGAALQAAEVAGLYVIRAMDSTASIVNSEGFKPAIY